MMKIGFTGTRQGMSNRQFGHLRFLLQESKCTEFHHGDCLGADKQAHKVARRLGIRVIIHPPENDKHRAFCKGQDSRQPKSYLIRNHDIVDETFMLIAAPFDEKKETVRSGTWATIRYSHSQKGKQLVVMNR